MARGCRAWTMRALNPPTRRAGSLCRRQATDSGPNRPKSSPGSGVVAISSLFENEPSPAGTLFHVAEVDVDLVSGRRLRPQLAAPGLERGAVVVPPKPVVGQRTGLHAGRSRPLFLVGD